MFYAFYNEAELEKVLRAIKDRVRPSFRRFKYTEILAEGERIVFGRYGSLLFLISEMEFEEPIEKFEVEITPIDNGKAFSFGKYRIDRAIEIDAVFDEELFYNLLPAFLAELTIARLNTKDCMLSREYVMKKASEIRDLSKKVWKDYESYALILAQERDSFFLVYSDFSSKSIKAEVAISNAKFLSSKLGNFMIEEVSRIEAQLFEVKKYLEILEKILKEIENRLNLVYLQVEMERRKNELEINRKTSAITAAAVVIEFVAVAYYSLKIWESYLPIERMPKILSFTLLMLFTVSIIFLTEEMGSYLVRKRKKGLTLSMIAVFISLVLMIISPLLYPESLSP